MSERSDSMADAIEKHADLILRASGSGLRHYTMQKTRAAILMAVADCFEEAYRAGAEFGRELRRFPMSSPNTLGLESRDGQ